MIQIFSYCSYDYSKGYKLGTPSYENNGLLELSVNNIPEIVKNAFYTGFINDLYGLLPDKIGEFKYIFIRKNLENQKDGIKIYYNFGF